jgi:aryl-alcohol dehydrogenase-like predicted oxidoreductase
MFAWQFEKAFRCSERYGWAKFITMQNHYSLLYREDERELMAACEDAGVACTPYGATASGKCCRPWGAEDNRESNDYKVREKYAASALIDKPVVDRIEEVAKNRDIPMIQVALAWVLSKPPVVAPIMGVRNPDHLEDIVGAVNVVLTEEEKDYLEDLYVPHPIVGAMSKEDRYKASSKGL